MVDFVPILRIFETQVLANICKPRGQGYGGEQYWQKNQLCQDDRWINIERFPLLSVFLKLTQFRFEHAAGEVGGQNHWGLRLQQVFDARLAGQAVQSNSLSGIWIKSFACSSLIHHCLVVLVWQAFPNETAGIEVNVYFRISVTSTYLSFKPGSRDIIAGLIRRHCPSNFFPFNLAIAQGIAQFHGPAIRAMTSGQAPICMLMSEDDGKAQAMRSFDT